MGYFIQLKDGSASGIALMLIASVSAATFLLLPSAYRRAQLFWIVPCVVLAAFETVTDNIPLPPVAGAIALFLGTFVLSLVLSEHQLAAIGLRPGRATTALVCALLSVAAPAALVVGVSGDAAVALSVGGIALACCWPGLGDATAQTPSDYDPDLLALLILGYGILVLAPGFEPMSLESRFYAPEAIVPFLGVLIGFVAGVFALRHAFRENARLITSEQVARKAREESAQFLRRLVDTTPAAVFVKDLEGRYHLINTLAAEWCRRTESEVLGRTDFDLFPSHVAQSMREHDDLVIATGKPQSRDFMVRLSDKGPVHSIRSHKFPLLDGDGSVKQIAGLAIDMTAIKKHERELEAARFRAEEASCAKTNFLAHMSHELRTPLNAIIGFSEIIHSGALGPIGNDLYRQYAGDIHTAGRLLLANVDDLLEMSQFDSDNFEPAMQSLNLALMAADCCHLLRAQADRRQIKLEIERTRSLPLVMGDLRATTHVLVDLIGNAIKHLPPGTTITLAGGRTESGAPYLLVEDDGPGKTAEDLQALVDPWTFRPATKADDGRGGLGLLLARKLMEAQGGRLIVDNSPTAGTRIACQFAAPAQDKKAGRALA